MNDILKTYMERFRENRHTLRRYTAFVLALAMITTLFVNWQLHGVGISMTAQYQCGEEEHTHTADCYTKVLTCGYEEGELENADEVAAAAATSQPTVEAEPAPLSLEPQIEFVPHEHTEDCYTEVQTLTCMEEEHVHGDDCFDPEDGALICEKFEHTHDENCYTTEYELTCGLEEGELVEQVVEPTQSAELAAMAVAEPVALEPTVDTVEPIYHHHTDACYEEVLTCPLPEHHHTVACLSDTSADVETPEEWQAANDEAVMTGNWDEDLLSVAKTQLGYEQSEKNFEIDPADGVTLRYYSRYGEKLTLKGLSRIFYVSESSLSSYISGMTGLSFFDLLNEMRIGKTANYLLYTDLTLEEIAAALGYVDASHISKVFSARVGMRINDYRKTYRRVESICRIETDRRVYALVEYICRSYNEPLSARAVAEKFGCTAAEMNRALMLQVEKNFEEFLNYVRINRAAELLLTTDQTVTYIAMEVGYANVKTFNRNFLRFKVMTPGDFRKKVALQESRL